MQDPLRRRRAWWGVALATALLAVACSAGAPSTTTTTAAPPLTQPPCGPGASRVELAAPLVGGPTAAFTTSGGTLYVHVGRFEHGGPFDPRSGSATVYVGSAETAPTYDRQTNVVTPAGFMVHVEEGEFAAFELPRGRYWLWTSNGAELVVVSCEATGVADGQRP